MGIDGSTYIPLHALSTPLHWRDKNLRMSKELLALMKVMSVFLSSEKLCTATRFSALMVFNGSIEIPRAGCIVTTVKIYAESKHMSF